MIDWLNIQIPFSHFPIKQGRRLIIDHDGQITSDFVLLRSVKKSFDECGSYLSSIAIQSIDTDYTNSQIKNLPSGHVSGISIHGNPTKYIQGHNVFGISCIRSLVIAVIKDAMPKLGFTDFDIARMCQLVTDWHFLVTKIDITHMFDIGTDADVNNYLRMMRDTVSARGDRCEFCKNTFYIAKGSGLWAFKFYNKLKEISSRSKYHRLPDFLPFSDFSGFVSGQLRVELVLHKKQLQRLDLMDPQILQTQLDNIFNEFSEKITMKNQEIKEIDYFELSSAYQATIAHWRQGKDLKSILPRNTFYRHRSKLLPLGIDIKNPPIKKERRVAYVCPVKVLAPKQVVDIPSHLSKYMVKQLEFAA